MNRGLWWLAPAGVTSLTVFLSLGAAWLTTDEVFRRAWDAPKSLTTDTVQLLAILALVFILASLLTVVLAGRRAAPYSWPAVPRLVLPNLRKAHWGLFVATCVGYLALLGAGVSRGVRPADIAARLVGDGSADQLKAQFAPITGVTSLTQMGIGFVIVTALLLISDPRRGEALRLAFVLALALGRTLLASERLAILELLLPLVAIGAMALSQRLRGVLRLAPLLLLPVVVAVFAVFEHGRSWAFHQSTHDGSYLMFAGERLAGYYVTAFNNGQLVLSRADTGVPYLSVQGIWEAPGVAQLGAYERLNGAGPPDVAWLLTGFANPEFNNPCGLCLPLHDFGPWGAAVFFATLGVLVTMAYIAFLNAHLVGLLVYPALFTGLWELPRYLYWTQGRLLPVLAVLMIIGVMVSGSLVRRQEQSHRAPHVPAETSLTTVRRS